jgi:hypothetical protein
MRFCREDFFGEEARGGGVCGLRKGVRNAAERKGDLEIGGVAGEGMKGVLLG